MLLAQAVDTTTVADADSFLFSRNAAGTLVLVGVTFRGQPARELYQYNAAYDGRWMSPDDQHVPSLGTLLASK